MSEETMFRSSLLIISAFIAGSTSRLSSPIPRAGATHHHTPDVRELVTSARGVAPTVCMLAADGVASTGRWGGGYWDAPSMSIGTEVRMRIREMLRARLDRDDQRALLEALGSEDACVRHLSATIIGRSEDKSFVAPLSDRANSAAPGE